MQPIMVCIVEKTVETVSHATAVALKSRLYQALRESPLVYWHSESRVVQT
jgi:hypothetical protein